MVEMPYTIVIRCLFCRRMFRGGPTTICAESPLRAKDAWAKVASNSGWRLLESGNMVCQDCEAAVLEIVAADRLYREGSGG